MASLFKFIFIFLFSLNLYSTSNNLMDDFFLLQKQKKSLNKDINLIYLTYSLGYPEKSIQKLYILLDQYTKTEFDENIKEIFNILKTKDYDKDIVNAISFIINNENPKNLSLDKEIISIYKNKKKPLVSVKKIINIEEKKQNLNKEKPITKKNSALSPKINNREKIELAIVASEWIDDFDMENSIKYSLMLKSDPYYFELASYLKYLNNKNLKPFEKIDKKSPTYYHFLISIYKKENNKEKALIYLNKLKKEYPYYLKYNKIAL